MTFFKPFLSPWIRIRIQRTPESGSGSETLAAAAKLGVGFNCYTGLVNIVACPAEGPNCYPDLKCFGDSYPDVTNGFFRKCLSNKINKYDILLLTRKYFMKLNIASLRIKH